MNELLKCDVCKTLHAHIREHAGRIGELTVDLKAMKMERDHAKKRLVVAEKESEAFRFGLNDTANELAEAEKQRDAARASADDLTKRVIDQAARIAELEIVRDDYKRAFQGATEKPPKKETKIEGHDPGCALIPMLDGTLPPKYGTYCTCRKE